MGLLELLDQGKAALHFREGRLGKIRVDLVTSFGGLKMSALVKAARYWIEALARTLFDSCIIMAVASGRSPPIIPVSWAESIGLKPDRQEIIIKKEAKFDGVSKV